MIKRLAALVGGTVALWALVTCAARLLWPEDQAVLWSTTAAVLCLVPTALTLAWTLRAHAGNAQQQLLAVMGGTMVRMVVVLGAGMALFLSIDEYKYQRFWLFVILYYLCTLALEMVIIVRGAPAGPAGRKNEGGVAR